MDWRQVLSVLGLLAVVLLVLAGAYLFTRWAGLNLGSGFLAARGSQLQVVDRVSTGRDQAVLVIKAGQRCLLLGSSPAGLTQLAELTQEEGENWSPPAPQEGPEQKRAPDFRALMQRLKEKK